MLEGNKTASTPTYFGLLVRTGSLSQELNMPVGSSEDTKAVFLQQEPHHMELLWPNGSPRAYGNWRIHIEEFMATGRKNPTGLKLILGFTLVGWDLESRAYGTVLTQTSGAQPASRLTTCTLPAQLGYLGSGAP